MFQAEILKEQYYMASEKIRTSTIKSSYETRK